MTRRPVLASTREWPVGDVACAVVGRGGMVLGSVGDVGRAHPLASVTKPLVAYAVLLAVEEFGSCQTINYIVRENKNSQFFNVH